MVLKLSSEEIQQQLDKLNPQWSIKNDKLSKQFVFKNFTNAFAFMTICAIEAEKAGHHPEWFNVYKKVNVQLITHEVGRVSIKDFELAKKMDAAEKLLTS